MLDLLWGKAVFDVSSGMEVGAAAVEEAVAAPPIPS